MDIDRSEISKVLISAELGNIYYDYNEEEDEFDTYRIVKIQNSETVTCMINDDIQNVKKFKLKDLKKNYQVLVSNAIMTVSKVIAAVTQYGTPVIDVVIMVYKRDAYTDTSTEADIICRQAISDIFYEPFCDQVENPYVGLSVTPKTCPAGYTMTELAICDEIVESKIINLYRTDTLDSILKLIDVKHWDNIILDIFNTRIKNLKTTYPFFKEPEPTEMCLDGYCRDLKTLFISNNFMYDFYEMLGISKVKFKIEYPYESDDLAYPISLSKWQVEILQDLYEINIEKTIVYPYDFSVNLDEIRMPYLLIMDNSDTLFIIGFTKSREEYLKSYSTIAVDQMSAVREKLSKAVDYYDKYSKK